MDFTKARDGCASLVIALITFGFQVVRAATANPADSLRVE